MTFNWRLESLHFSGGQEIPVESGSVLILIGPNGGGKSTALRDIEAAVAPRGEKGVVVPGVQTSRSGDMQDFRDWLREHYPLQVVNGRPMFRTTGGTLREDQVDEAWSTPDMRQALGFLVHRLDTATRLTVSNPIASIHPYIDAPQQYIHVLQAKEATAKAASAEVRAAFGVELLPSFVGPNVWFHVGAEPQRSADHDRVSERYLSELSLLPRLETQGDGIRSFVGCLLAALCGAHPVLLIDEPEAFLHPPQASRLARFLATTANNLKRQVIIATHSADVVRGAVDGSEHVAICRLTRQDNRNDAALLSSQDLKQLWSKPLLRSSSTLDGLFHQGVAICEADADCRFYEAIVQRLEVAKRLRGPVDLRFVHASGKGQLASLAGAYSAVKTRCAVVADIDLLRNAAEFEGVLRALGAEPEYVPGAAALRTAFGDRKPLVSLDELLGEARRILDEAERAKSLTPEYRRRLLTLLGGHGDWSEAKRYGVDRLRGSERKQVDALLLRLQAIGLFLVPKGELEGWRPQGSASDKNQWFIEAMKAMEEDWLSFQDAAAFVQGLCKWFGYDPLAPEAV